MILADRKQTPPPAHDSTGQIRPSSIAGKAQAIYLIPGKDQSKRVLVFGGQKGRHFRPRRHSLHAIFSTSIKAKTTPPATAILPQAAALMGVLWNSRFMIGV